MAKQTISPFPLHNAQLSDCLMFLTPLYTRTPEARLSSYTKQNVQNYAEPSTRLSRNIPRSINMITPLKHYMHLNEICGSEFLLTKNILCLHQKEQAVNAVEENNRINI
jgi:hypothetical protein